MLGHSGETSASSPYLSRLGHLQVLPLSVEPGFGGQKFQPAMMEKVRALRQRFPSIQIEVCLLFQRALPKSHDPGLHSMSRCTCRRTCSCQLTRLTVTSQVA